jgi:hypothetical protein
VTPEGGAGINLDIKLDELDDDEVGGTWANIE